MIRYVATRLVWMLPTLVLVTVVAFLMLHLAPGDPAELLAPADATAEDVQRLREELGLADPLPLQYVRYMARLLRGDLGYSYASGQSVARELLPRFAFTLRLATASLVLAVLVGLPAGVVAAVRVRSWADHVSMVGSVVGLSVPAFWLGVMLMLVFSVRLGWLPSAGAGTWKHLILPTLTLSTWSIAIIARMTRASMLEVLGMDYVRVARAKGLHERTVIVRHALRNALIPIVTVAGLRFGYMLGGAVVTETVFAWPGMGRFMVQSIQARDFPNLQGGILLFALAFALTNLLVDLCYGLLDPQVRYQG